MLNRPRVTSTALAEPALGMLSDTLFKIDCGKEEQIGMLQSHASTTSVERITGSTACTFAVGLE